MESQARGGVDGTSSEGAGPRACSRAPHDHTRLSLGVRARPGAWGARRRAGWRGRARARRLHPPFPGPGLVRGRPARCPSADTTRDRLPGRPQPLGPTRPCRLARARHARSRPPEARGQPSTLASGLPVPRRPAPPPSSGSRQAPPPSSAWAGPMLSFPPWGESEFCLKNKGRCFPPLRVGAPDKLTPSFLSPVCKCPSFGDVRVNCATQIPCSSRSPPSPAYTSRILL